MKIQLKRWIQQWGEIILVWGIILIGSFFRIYEADRFPINQNDDSPFYVWLGNSLEDNWRQPSSLTIFETDNQYLFWRSQYHDYVPLDRFGFRLTNLWFDHPFFGSLLIALPARIFGYTGFSQIPQLLVRTPALIASIAVMWLTYHLAKIYFGKVAGMIALIILAVWPLAVFSQRQSYLENMLTPWLLGGLILVSLDRHRQKSRFLIPTILCAVISAWIKIPGYWLFGLYAFAWYVFGHRREAIITGISGFVSLGVYFIYGYLIGGYQFFWTITQQGGRGAYLGSIFKTIIDPQIYGQISDGWWFIGLGSTAFLLQRKMKEGGLIALAVVWWASALFFLSGPDNTSPWYRYPAYPLMAIAAGVFIRDGYRRKYGIFVLLIILMLGLTGWSLAGIEWSSQLIRGFMVTGLGITAMVYLFKPRWEKWVRSVLLSVVFILALWGNGLAIIRYPERYCQDNECIHPERITLPWPKP